MLSGRVHVLVFYTLLTSTCFERACCSSSEGTTLYILGGELSYLAPLGSENISAPYFKQCFFQKGGEGVLPHQTVKHHASQFQDKFTLMFINERKRNANNYLISNFDSLEAAPSNLPP